MTSNPLEPTQDTQGASEKPTPQEEASGKQIVASDVITYLAHPKITKKLSGSFEGLCETDYDYEVAKKLINSLSEPELGKLIEYVITVCAQWSAMRVAPDNDIGTVARCQEADLIISHRLSQRLAETGADDE